jgi:hypothetical protein
MERGKYEGRPLALPAGPISRGLAPRGPGLESFLVRSFIRDACGLFRPVLSVLRSQPGSGVVQ